MATTWRDRIRPLIAEVIERVGRSNPKALKKALLDARPNWVTGASWMTKVWRDEVKCQLGQRQFNKPSPTALSKDQLNLF